MARNSVQPAVSVTIPCYRQLALAQQAVEAFLAQSFDDFRLTLVVDGGSAEYEQYVMSLGDPRVQYQGNPERRGAMANMFGCIAAGEGTYTVAFHEDDLPDRRFLAAAVSVLEAEPRCGFVASELQEFRGAPPSAGDRDLPVEHMAIGDGAAFLRAIFRGIEPMFGSVVYRRAALCGMSPELHRYGTLADRPFLLSILQEWSCAVIRRPVLAWYRAHDDERRHQGMTADHVLNLFARYRREFPERWSADDETLFYQYSGFWLMRLYQLTPSAQRPALPEFLFRAMSAGLYNLRFAKRYGRKRLLTDLLFAR